MKAVTVALVGIGGYGVQYLNWFDSDSVSKDEAVLTCVVDPVAEQSSRYPWVVAQNLPRYNTLEEMYAQQQVDLVIIASPTQFHKQQAMTALANGSFVLCEKPLVPIAQEASELLAAENASGGYSLGVGFQWSFSRTMNRVKADILAGKYGKPVMAKTFVSWPRAHTYYQDSFWKGKILGNEGQPILDSILANATAHYLHNIFFLLGDQPDTSAMPTQIETELFRANDIQSFDTCFLRGTFPSGGQFYYVASHAVAEDHSPTFYYEFEKGVISFNHWEEDDTVRGILHSGEVIEYGNPFTAKEQAEKVGALARSIQAGEPIVCTVKTILPHLLVSNSVFDYATITDFPRDIVAEDRLAEGNFIPSLYQVMRSCFAEAQLPHEQKVPWSHQVDTIDLTNYNGFTGRQVPGYQKP